MTETMKCLLICLVVPVVFAAPPGKRALVSDLLDHGALSTAYHTLLSSCGANETETQCEDQCKKILNNDLLDYGCSLVCHAVQSGCQKLDGGTTTATGKRALVSDLLDHGALSTAYHTLLSSCGADETEAKCEDQCKKILNNALLDYGCPLVCHAVQSGCQKLDGGTTTATGKRALVSDLLDHGALSTVYHTLLSSCGADETEAKCEDQCKKILNNALLDYGCPLVCHAVQSGCQKLDGGTTTATGKRALVSDLLDHGALSTAYHTLLSSCGADETEAKCEDQCKKILNNALLDYGCPLVCHAVQSGCQKLDGGTRTAGPVKRFLVPDVTKYFTGLTNHVVHGFQSVINNAEVQKVYHQLVHTFTTDETEKACENLCHSLIAGEGSSLEYSCQFICPVAQNAAKQLESATTTVNKRFLIDTLLANPELNLGLHLLVDTLGSDPTEQACEKKCVDVFTPQSLLHHSCPLVCHSFQEIVHKIHLDSEPSHPER